jgi:NADH-quinone oxidoreductase subunit N
VNPLVEALTGYIPALAPEIVLGVAACVLFLGATWCGGRRLWGGAALASLAVAGAVLAFTAVNAPTVESIKKEIETYDKLLVKPAEQAGAYKSYQEHRDADITQQRANAYAAPVQHSKLSVLFAAVALAGGVVLVLLSWNDVPDEHAAEYHACLLLIIAGVALVGAANELITLFLSLELVSIPTYVLLYLPRSDVKAQESAMKYFLLSIFSSALLLFGFSYLYGVAGTTNIPAIVEALSQPTTETGATGLALVAVVLVAAGLGFRLAAAPFHFYAPDVYEGTTNAVAAVLAFAPKVAAVAALVRVLGFVPGLGDGRALGLDLGGQTPRLLWILAAVTMSLGNLLALLQDNLRRLLAYSSVAHAGYMLVGLAVAPKLGVGATFGGVEAVLFYLVAYGAMTIGVFAVISSLSTPKRPVESVKDLEGLSSSHPGAALAMVLFLFSLIGMPSTAGFVGKFLIFLSALGPDPARTAGLRADGFVSPSQDVWFFRALALIMALNAAVGAWYYLRIAALMYFRNPLKPLAKVRQWPALAAVAACAVVTLGLGVYADPLARTVKAAMHSDKPSAPAGGPAGPSAAAPGP